MPIRKTRKRYEADEQIAFVRWFKYQNPQHLRSLMRIRNEVDFSGNSKDPRARGKFFWKIKREKLLGLQKGALDLFLAVPKGQYSGLFIEMKADDGKLSADQKEFIKEHSEKYKAIVCYSADEAIKLTDEYLKL